MPYRNKVVYCSWSSFKVEEWECVRNVHSLPGYGSAKLDTYVDLEFRQVSTHEPLLCDLTTMVHAKVLSAYEAVKVPCVVEHAGLILEGFETENYPGGLTQPMWDALGAERFVKACRPLAQKALARAVIGYCDGMHVKTFVGEMTGTLSDQPRGQREFYWDTIFCPDGFDGKTYAEVVSDTPDGLAKKMEVSQSIKALKQMIEYQINHKPALFPGL